MSMRPPDALPGPCAELWVNSCTCGLWWRHASTRPWAARVLASSALPCMRLPPLGPAAPNTSLTSGTQLKSPPTTRTAASREPAAKPAARGPPGPKKARRCPGCTGAYTATAVSGGTGPADCGGAHDTASTRPPSLCAIDRWAPARHVCNVGWMHQNSHPLASVVPMAPKPQTLPGHAWPGPLLLPLAHLIVVCTVCLQQHNDPPRPGEQRRKEAAALGSITQAVDVEGQESREGGQGRRGHHDRRGPGDRDRGRDGAAQACWMACQEWGLAVAGCMAASLSDLRGGVGRSGGPGAPPALGPALLGPGAPLPS